MDSNFDALLTGARPAAARAITHRKRARRRAAARPRCSNASIRAATPTARPGRRSRTSSSARRRSSPAARTSRAGSAPPPSDAGSTRCATSAAAATRASTRRSRPSAAGTLGDLTAERGPGVHELVELRERLRDAAGEQRAALALPARQRRAGTSRADRGARARQRTCRTTRSPHDVNREFAASGGHEILALTPLRRSSAASVSVSSPRRHFRQSSPGCAGRTVPRELIFAASRRHG